MAFATVFVQIIKFPSSFFARTNQLPTVIGQESTFIEVFEADIFVSFTMSGREDRNQALAFHRNDVMTAIFSRIFSIRQVKTSCHDVHDVTDLVREATYILFNSGWPMGNHRGTDTAFI